MNAFYPSNRPPLQPMAYVPLPLGAVKPAGWLLRECRVQAEGLTGHIGEVWADLGPDNMWLGGKGEGWERGPYYLDGLIPLAHILDDERLKGIAKKWLDSILSMQDESGWIGPVASEGHKSYDQWPLTIVMKVFVQHYEATGDERIIPAMTAYFGYLHRTLGEKPLFDWGSHRWADLAWSIHWLYNRTGEAWLVDLANTVRKQGFNWRGYFEDFKFTEKTPREGCTRDNHVVNNAMAIKAGGIAWAETSDEGDCKSVRRAQEVLDRYHGQVTGVFTGDEHYAGKEPTQGTELCAVVEYMFSLEILLSLWGEVQDADRLERIAYNALPATLTPDMWAHQYDQQVNQVLCTVAPRAWTNNEPDSNVFGLEPNFGCCTANYHQGWPKLVSHLWMGTPDNGLVAVAYGPSTVTAKVGDGVSVTINETTDYPFRGFVQLAVETDRPVSFPLIVRIPAWASGAMVGAPKEPMKHVEAGTWHRIEREWSSGDTVEIVLPMEVRTEERTRGGISVLSGPLVFGLRIGEEFRLLKGNPPAADWEVHPTTPWNYGLEVRDGSLNATVEESEVPDVPFSTENPPVVLRVPARRIPGWDLENDQAGPLPQSPVQSAEPLETVELVPYGSTNLRIGEFPVVA